MTYGSLKALMIAMVAGQSGIATAQEVSPDDSAWEAAKASGTSEACQQYLTEFPTGSHAEEAFRCLVEGVIPASAVNRQDASVDIY
jgi:hypothetical protein